MGSILIRKVDDRLKRKLRVRAAKHGRSMEDEARDILKSALSKEAQPPRNLYDAIRARIEPLGGVDLPELPSEPVRDPPKFGE
jgi:plasmid stability protein